MNAKLIYPLKKLALIGNPNSGKTTLFNNLTGAHQRVGNWAGVTVERKSGNFTFAGHSYEVVDLPGIYSLEQESQGIDEDIARLYLETESPELIINIIDASNLERSLVLTNQLLEKNIPMVVVLNMQDVAIAQGVDVDSGRLERRLGVPVVNAIASSRKGMEHLLKHIENQLDPDKQVVPEMSEAAKLNTKDTSEKILWRYKQVETLTDGVMSRHRLTPVTERIDKWALNKWLGIPIFLVAMYMLFTFAINFGAVFIDFFDILFTAVFVDGSRHLLEQMGSPELLTTFVSDGIGGGVTLVATFIPVIGFLYLGLALMEDSGYIARAAFVVDRLMVRIGLPGTAFVPLIVGFGCNVPAVMATRSLQHHNERLMTIAMAPFMSCGARLTVYALFAAAFFPQQGQNIVFLLYILGIIMAVLTGFIFKKRLFSGALSPSFQEMPAYHRPLFRNILLMTWFRLRGFILRAGKAIVVVVVVLSMLSSLGTDGSLGNEDSEKSVLSKIGMSITPVFEPIGVREDNWPATVGLFTGMFAKEVVVGTLDTLYTPPAIEEDEPYNLGASIIAAFESIGAGFEDLGASLSDPLGISIGDVEDLNVAIDEQEVSMSTISVMVQQFGGQLPAFTYLVFILLYAPCVAVVGAMVKESGWPWAILIFSWTTAVAYYTASTIYLLATVTNNPVYHLGFISVTSLMMAGFVYVLPRIASRSVNPHRIPSVEVS
jgi:ferrous iron transport protein B